MCVYIYIYIYIYVHRGEGWGLFCQEPPAVVSPAEQPKPRPACFPRACARTHTDTQTHRHTDTHTNTHRHKDTQTHRHTDTHTNIRTRTHTDTKIVAQTHRHTEEISICGPHIKSPVRSSHACEWLPTLPGYVRCTQRRVSPMGLVYLRLLLNIASTAPLTYPTSSHGR
jgi:hypothetical protein